MKYKNDSAFRQALENRIAKESGSTGIPIQRLRKWIAFDRFLARLVSLNPKDWILKGGFMMELFFQKRARTTKDIDLHCRLEEEEIYQQLQSAGSSDLNDWFRFEVAAPQSENQFLQDMKRFNVKSLLVSRQFENFHVDVNSSDMLMDQPKEIDGMDLLAFAEIPPIKILCYPLTQQVAEKIHALSRTYQSGEVSRVKDVVDILLIASSERFSSRKLRDSITSTFQNRNSSDLDTSIPRINSIYSRDYASMARQIGLTIISLDEANNALKSFLLPILQMKKPSMWNPAKWKWE